MPKKSRTDSGPERAERAKWANAGAGELTTNSSGENRTAWVEPPLRPPAPSYEDTPWSGVSNAHNPVLHTMRPLGQGPTPADLRKTGLLNSAKPSPHQTPANDGGPVKTSTRRKRSSRPAKRGMFSEKPASSAKEEAAWPDNSKAGFDEDLAALARLPLPDSSEFNVAKLKTVIEAAMHLAAASGSRVVSMGLLRIWANSNDDQFILYILDGMVNGSGPREVAAFQTLVHRAVHEVRSENEERDAAKDVNNVPHVEPTVNRSGSVVSSTSALSSAKSLDEDESSQSPQETLEVKRNRLRKTFPDFVAHESSLRSSLSRASRSLTPPSAEKFAGAATELAISW